MPGEFLQAGATSCSLCYENNWCPGGTFSASTSDQGTNICPNDGQSVGNTSSIYQCYKDQLPTYISNGTGDETCFYGTIGYTEKCIKYVRSCDGGYYSEKGNDYCSTAGIGYYSPQGDLNRYQCPGTKNGGKGETETETASNINQCIISKTIYTTGNNEVINGVGLTSCSYSETTKGYGIAEIMNLEPLTLPKGPITDPQCTNSKIVFCFGGYFLENDSGLECGPVGDGYYSPRPNFNEMTGCIDKSDNCPYELDVEVYQSSRGREACPTEYPLSQLPRNSEKTCYKECKTDISNAKSVTPVKATILYLSWGKDPEPVCQYNVECNTGYKVVDNGTEKAACVSDESSGGITCAGGEYLPANSSTCSSCMNGGWCPGGTFSASTSDQGTNICPNDGQSVGNTSSIYQCYKDQLPTYISNGTGDETCFYGTIGYTEKCIKYVRSCDGGYYSEKGNDYCSTAGIGYYSPQGDLNRYQCPGTKNGGKGETETETASNINQCIISKTIYTTGNNEVINGVGLTSCSYSETTKGYGIAEIMNLEPLTLPKGPITDPQCTNSKIVFCFGGYFLENDTGLECGPVGDGYYSPRPNFNEITGCLDKSGNCPYEFDVEIYQSSRGREKCPDPYIHSELPRNTMKKCYKDCILDVPNSIKVTPTNSKIYITSGGIGEPQPTCKFNVECEEGYKVLENDSEKPSCILDGSICQNDPNALESDSKCVPTKCKDGYHIENSKCIANVVACDIENGLGRKEWMGDNRLNGKWTMCTAYKCNPGYTSERYLTNETDKPCGECKNRRDASGNIAVSAWKEYNCEIATCMYQGELYRLDSTNNTCVQICDTAGREDLTGTMIWDPLSEKCERTCKPGFTSW